MNKRSTGRSGSERGAAIVEFALVLPILMALVIGIVTMGAALNDKQSLTHAAREGTRYGSRLPTDQTFESGTWATNVRDVTLARSGGDLDTEAGAEVCVSLVSGSPATTFSGPFPATSYSTASGSVACDPSETYEVTDEDDGLRVQVRVTRPAVIEAIFFSMSVDVASDATMQSEFAS